MQLNDLANILQVPQITCYADHKKFDDRHGGPFDRGSADSWYGRPFSPHYFKGATYQTDKVTNLTPQEYAEYEAGYKWNERFGDKKDWGTE